jgi:hypothetical protein
MIDLASVGIIGQKGAYASLKILIAKDNLVFQPD